MPQLSKLISYFKDCYQADTRTLVFNNLFSAKVENRYILGGNDELLNGNLPFYPIAEEYAQEVEKNLSIYAKEKVFYCAAFSIIGKSDEELKKDRKICAPLFLYPAKIIRRDDTPFVRINFEKRIININFLNSIKDETVDDIHEAIVDHVPNQFEADISTVSIIRKVLETKLQDFHSEEALMYPQLVDERRLKVRLQPKQLDQLDGFHLIPTVAFCIVKRSTSTQGIITELNSLAKQKDYSEPIKDILGQNSQIKSTEELDKGWVPTILSNAQEDIISSTNQNLTTLVIGPPGTGKSYSIAALALNFMSKGKSVLIASKTDQAVDVIHDKIKDDLDIKGVAFRAGKSSYKKRLKGQLENLMAASRRRPKKSKYLEIQDFKKELLDCYNDAGNSRDNFYSLVKNEFKWARTVSENMESPSLFGKIKSLYIKWRNALQNPHWTISKQFLYSTNRSAQLVKEIIQTSFSEKVRSSLYENRLRYRTFLKSLSARNSSRQDMLLDQIDLNRLLETFPIWLVNMSDIHGVFPMQKEVFDLAIIDEASQCDIASCLPIIQRAKRIVIVGDPKQLRHSSFLSRSMQASLQKKNDILSSQTDVSLDYRATSILDLVDEQIRGQDQISFLDEHFRSKPDLIDFSNKHFYGSNLRIMTDFPRKEHVAHRIIVDSGGKRDKNGVNKIEADHLIRDIKKIIQDQKDLTEGLAQTIGILSPFRDQVEYLGQQVQSEIDLHFIIKHKIRCGTAYSFQGEERDIMFLSFAIDQDSHHSAVIHMNKPDVFNVSITRARTMQYIYKSFNDNFNAGKYVNQYISEIRNANSNVSDDYFEIRDKFLIEVKKSLAEKGLELWVGHSVAGLLVDIVVKKENQHFGINLIGYPGKYEAALEIDDYKILMRAGLPTFPLPYTYWSFDADQCFEELMCFIDE